MAERPTFIGGPLDGDALDETFPPGHALHGSLPNRIRVPTNSPPAEPGPVHVYEFLGGNYQYQGTAERKRGNR